MTFTSIGHADHAMRNCNAILQVKEVLEYVYGGLDHVRTPAINAESSSILQGCLPLLMEQVPAETLIQLMGQKKYEQLRYLCRQSSILNLWYSSEMKRIFDVMAAAQIRVMVLKGADVAASLYPRPELRPLHDIDLMVQPKDLAATIAILEKLGYHYHQEYRFEAVSKQRTGFVYAKGVPVGHLMFEVHTAPHGNEMGVSFAAARLWERARPITIAGMETYGMGLEDLLLYLCWHYRSHVFGRLIWLYDIALLLLCYADQLDWALVRRLAREQELMATIYYTVRLCQQAFHITIPENARIEQCMPPVFIQRLITRLVGNDLTSVLRKTAQRERKLLHYLVVDNVSALCLVWWRTVFPSPEALGYRYMDHSRLPLHLFWLYYPLHPLLALRRYFRARSLKKSSHRQNRM